METTGLEVREEADGCSLLIRVRPGARAEGVAGLHAGALKLSVTAAPERGRANEAVLGLLSRILGVPRGAIALASGHSSRSKRVMIRGVTPESLRARLEAL